MRLSTSPRLDTTPGVASPAVTMSLGRSSPGAFAELLRLFEWRDAAGHRRRSGVLERLHLEAVVSRLNLWLTPDVRAELDALPDEAYLALARAPEVFHAAFHRPRRWLDDAMRRWIAVEQARRGARTFLDGDLTSAAWDRVVIARGGRVLAIEPSPRLLHGPTLDFCSELPNRLITQFPQLVLVPPDADEQREAAHKLDTAFDVLRAVSPLARELVRDLTQVMCARTAVDDLRFTTTGDATSLGVIHLANAHTGRKTPAEIAGELVREAIHQALFRWELRYPLFVDPDVATAKVRSPWTGAVLDVHGFVHACFVWYGVANLWRLDQAPRELAVVRKRRIAEAGFARKPLACLGQHRRALTPSLRAAIAEMTEQLAG